MCGGLLFVCHLRTNLLAADMQCFKQVQFHFLVRKVPVSGLTYQTSMFKTGVRAQNNIVGDVKNFAYKVP